MIRNTFCVKDDLGTYLVIGQEFSTNVMVLVDTLIYRCYGDIFSGKMFSLWDNLKAPSCTYRGLLVIFLINRLIYTETLPHPKI